MKTRLIQYDILKGIGILLVLLGHTEQLPLHTKMYIYAFHMPLFFFLSGVFFKPGSIKNVIVKGLKQLMVPWTFFLGVLYLGYLLVSLKAGGLGVFLDVITKHSNPLDEDAKLWLSIWFLPCLFMVRTLYSSLVSVTNRIGGVRM